MVAKCKAIGILFEEKSKAPTGMVLLAINVIDGIIVDLRKGY